MWITVRRLTVVVAIALAGVGFPDPAGADSSAFVARSEKGFVHDGMVSVDRRPAPSKVFWVSFVVPQGTTVSSGAVLPFGVDPSRPWVVMSAGSSDGTGRCSTWANPSSYSVGAQEGNRWTGQYVDVACDDGAGYDAYRFTWTPVGAFGSYLLNSVDWGTEPIVWSTDAATGMITTQPEATQHAYLTVCGLRRGRVPDCLGRWNGRTLFSATGVVTTGTTSN